MPKQWPLKIEVVHSNSGPSSLYSRGHHAAEEFSAAAVAGYWWEPGEELAISHEYWRLVPIPDQDYPLTIVIASGPGKGAMPVTAEAVP